MIAASFAANAAATALGVVFVGAGVSKAVMGTAWTSQAQRLGTPRRVAAAVPWIEIVVGAAVAARLAIPWSAIAALALLTAFTAVLVARLASGDHPPCACFGAWSTRPLSWWHVVRNGAMMALAVIAIAA